MKQLYQKYKALTPVLLLTIFGIWTIADSFMEIITLTPKQYGGVAAVTINLIAFFAFRPYYKYVLLLTLLLGLINLINFTPAVASISFGIGSAKLAIEPTSLFIGILAYLINFKRVNELFFQRFGTTPEQADKYQQQVAAEQIEKYKKRYSDYSDELLNNILTENKYAPEALAAARQILNERQLKEK